ncbi:hypothetical protein [Natrinema pallidum]|nr:hypothetical protein [Natrinema pallidum]
MLKPDSELEISLEPRFERAADEEATDSDDAIIGQNGIRRYPDAARV